MIGNVTIPIILSTFPILDYCKGMDRDIILRINLNSFLELAPMYFNNDTYANSDENI